LNYKGNGGGGQVFVVRHSLIRLCRKLQGHAFYEETMSFFLITPLFRFVCLASGPARPVVSAFCYCAWEIYSWIWVAMWSGSAAGSKKMLW